MIVAIPNHEASTVAEAILEDDNARQRLSLEIHNDQQGKFERMVRSNSVMKNCHVPDKQWLTI